MPEEGKYFTLHEYTRTEIRKTAIITQIYQAGVQKVPYTDKLLKTNENEFEAFNVIFAHLQKA